MAYEPIGDAVAGACIIAGKLAINPCKCSIEDIDKLIEHLRTMETEEHVKPAIDELIRRLETVKQHLQSEGFTLDDLHSLVEWCELALTTYKPLIYIEHQLEMSEQPQEAMAVTT